MHNPVTLCVDQSPIGGVEQLLAGRGLSVTMVANICTASSNSAQRYVHRGKCRLNFRLTLPLPASALPFRLFRSSPLPFSAIPPMLLLLLLA